MLHTVWKLAALGAVVAVGVVVVIYAQRGMQEQGNGPGNEVAASLGDGGTPGPPDDLFDEGDLPAQGEPEMADESGDERKIVPAAATRRGARGRASAVALDDADVGLNDTGADETEGAPSESTKPAADDPFGDLNGVEELEAPAKTAPVKPAPAKGRGPVLTLDELEATEDDGKPSGNSGTAAGGSGPKLLGAEEDSAIPAAAKSKQADPFADDDDLPAVPAKNRSTAIADDEDEPADDDLVPPAPLPKPAPGEKSKSVGKPKSVAGDPFQEEQDEAPQLGDNDDDRPARPGPTIETDDAADPPVEPRRVVKPLLPEDKADSAVREIEIPAQRRGSSPALPLADEPMSEEPPPKPEPPQLTIEKLAPSTAVLGRPLVYQIVVRNTGDIPAHQVVVEDIIPEGVQMDGSIPQAQLRENRLIWKLGTIPPGRDRKISVRVVPQREGVVGSVATVNFSPIPALPANSAAPRLKVRVDAPRKAAVGTPVEFSFRVQNIGPVPATRVTIRDVLPAGLKHDDGNDLEYEIGSIAPGKSSEVKLTLTAAQSGPTINRVVVTADGNVSESAEVQLDVVGPALTLARSSPKRLYPGKTGRFANTVTNPGPGTILKISVVEIVPAGMEFVDAPDGGTYDAARRTVSWTIDRLDAGESKTVKLTLRSAARGAQISVVRAYDGSGASSETIGTTQVAGVPALKIETGELPSLVEVGETVTVSVRILNRGSDAADNVRAVVPVPAGLKFLSAAGAMEHRVAPVAAGEGTPARTEVQFGPVAKIDAKGEATFELTFKGRAPGETQLVVQARCDQMSEPIQVREPLTVALPE